MRSLIDSPLDVLAVGPLMQGTIAAFRLSIIAVTVALSAVAAHSSAQSAALTIVHAAGRLNETRDWL